MRSPFSAFQASKLPLIEAELHARLPLSSLEGTQRLNQALRYAVRSGGKRLRPLLALLAAQIFALPSPLALALACAVEYLHLSSVILDDLPAMDDAQMRRHLPALHLAFDEAVAILAALALYTRAFELLAPWPALVEQAARAVGSEGMIAGQAADLAGVRPTRLRKTAPLFRLALRAPAEAAAASAEQIAGLENFGELVGRAYQLCDDLLDALAAESVTGKTGDQDRRHGRDALSPEFGAPEALRELNELIAQARAALRRSLPPCSACEVLADFARSLERRAAELVHGHDAAVADGGCPGAGGG